MIQALWLVLTLAAADSAQAPADTTAVTPDTSAIPPRRIVRRLEEVVVRASPLHDMLSSQSVQIVTREDLRTLPVDRVTDAIGLK
ncbi:MAG TPA: hypothetical protein VFP10_11555, partial [Candidatus Eisenbacteria bacterium]|nr:hypothetical protein [Candidatus Eisenbacteria bacterium]